MVLGGTLQKFPIWDLYRVSVYYIDIIKLRNYE